jgi:hypothetical protein
VREHAREGYRALKPHSYLNSFRGAYVIGQRHLGELDKLLHLLGSEPANVKVSLAGGRSFYAASFAAIGGDQIVERAVITQIDGERRSSYNSENPSQCSIPIYGTGSFGAVIRVGAEVTERQIEEFASKATEIESMIKVWYSFLYETKKEIFFTACLSLLTMFIAVTILIKAGVDVNRTGVGPFLGGVSVIFCLLVFSLVKRSLPPFVVEIGEGERWKRRSSAPLQWLSLRALTYVFTALLGAAVVWLFKK